MYLLSIKLHVPWTGTAIFLSFTLYSIYLCSARFSFGHLVCLNNRTNTSTVIYIKYLYNVLNMYLETEVLLPCINIRNLVCLNNRTNTSTIFYIKYLYNVLNMYLETEVLLPCINIRNLVCLDNRTNTDKSFFYKIFI